MNGTSTEAGLVIVNGQVLTADRSNPRAEAVAIRAGKVAAVGSNDEARQAAPDAQVIDAAGRTVLPGFVDAHNHFLATGESLGMADVRYPKVASVEDLVEVLAAAAVRAGTSSGGYVRAYGFDHAKYERVLPGGTWTARRPAARSWSGTSPATTCWPAAWQSSAPASARAAQTLPAAGLTGMSRACRRACSVMRQWRWSSPPRWTSAITAPTSMSQSTPAS